jgi:hypothetical protein
VNWTCPECGGAWIRNYVFDHNPETCRLRDREDATHHADYERLQHRYSPLKRAATSTELELLAVITGPENVPSAAETTVERVVAGIHVRTINGVNPDVLATGQPL